MHHHLRHTIACTNGHTSGRTNDHSKGHIHDRPPPAPWPLARQHLALLRAGHRPGAITAALLLALSPLAPSLGVAAFTALASPGAAAQTQAAARHYDIPAGPLSRVVSQFAAQAGLALSADASLTQGKNSPGLQGSHTPQSGLAALLAGTGLQAVPLSDGGYTLRAAPAPSAAPAPAPAAAPVAPGTVSLPAVTVAAPGESYVQQRSSAATGLDMSLKETPQSVSVVTQEQMRDQQINTVTDALHQVAGLSLGQNDDFRFRFFSRGFEIQNFQLDGHNLSPGQSFGRGAYLAALYDRVEVVKGAAGLLTGTGDPSAMINLVRKRADSQVFSGELDVNAGSWNNFGFSADISSPLNADKSVRGRLVFAHQQGNSFRDLKRERHIGLYGVIDADLSTDTKLSFGLSREDKRLTGSVWMGLPYYFSDGTRTHWSRNQTTAARWNHWEERDTTAFAEIKHTLPNKWQWDTALNYTKQVEPSTMLIDAGNPDRVTGLGITGEPHKYRYDPSNINFNTGLSIPFQALGFAQQASIKLHYNRLHAGWWSGNGDNGALLNADVAAGDVIGNFFTWNHHTPTPVWGGLDRDNEFITTEKAISFASRLQVSERAKLILGGRYTQWQQHNKETTWTPVANTVKENAFTPYLGLVYDVTPNVSAYASYTSIFKPQNNKDRNGRQLSPVRGNSYEIGIKSSWLDDRLMGTAAIYQTQQDNFAAPDTGYLVPGTSTVASRAVKGAKVKGYELELTGRITPAWNISAGWSHYSAKGPTGNHLVAHQPRKSFKLFTTYDFAGHVPGLKLGAGMRWYSRPPIQAENPGTGLMEAVGQPAYAVFDLMARYELNRQLALQLNIDNVTDKRYYHLSQWLPDRIMFGAPRSFRLSLNYAF